MITQKRIYTAPQGTIISDFKLSKDKKTLITIFEQEKPKFKKGDFVHSKLLLTHSEYGYISIYGDDKNYIFCMTDDSEQESNIKISSSESIDRFATSEEIERVKNKLGKCGKQWNSEKLCIEPLKYVPKVGDCVELSSEKNEIIIMIYGGLSKYGSHKNKGHYITPLLDIGTNTELGFDDRFCNFKQLTSEEYQSKFNAIGYEYDFETHTASKMNWKPKYGEHYLTVNPAIEIVESYNSDYASDRLIIESGNCFKVTDRQSAEKFLNYIKQYKP